MDRITLLKFIPSTESPPVISRVEWNEVLKSPINYDEEGNRIYNIKLVLKSEVVTKK